jgi:hypothetical protein
MWNSKKWKSYVFFSVIFYARNSVSTEKTSLSWKPVMGELWSYRESFSRSVMLIYVPHIPFDSSCHRIWTTLEFHFPFHILYGSVWANTWPLYDVAALLRQHPFENTTYWKLLNLKHGISHIYWLNRKRHFIAELRVELLQPIPPV